MGWVNNTFPLYPDPSEAGWMIIYWRVVKATNAQGNYRVKQRMFDHVDIFQTQQDAQDVFDQYVTDKKASGQVNGVKKLTLFLCEVQDFTRISDNAGEIINP